MKILNPYRFYRGSGGSAAGADAQPAAQQGAAPASRISDGDRGRSAVRAGCRARRHRIAR